MNNAIQARTGLLMTLRLLTLSPTNMMRMLVLAALTLSMCLWSVSSKAACSTYAGDAAFNEYYFGNDVNYLEVFIKNTSVIPQADWQGWTVRVYDAPGSYTDYTLNDTTSSYCTFGSKGYITQLVPGGLPSPDISVALLDAAGDEIDYLDVCGPPDSCSLPGYYNPEPAVCSTADHDHNISSLGNKDLARFPDGRGKWDISGGTGAGTSFTSCSPNSAGIIKVSDVAAVELGSNFTFTLQLLNSAKKDDDFFVEDTLPAGFTFVSATPSQGSVDVSALPIIGWDAGIIASKGGTASLDIVVTGSVLGLHENSARLLTPCSDPANCPQDFASVQVVPAAVTTDHFDINHDTTAINCQAEPVTIEAHLADHTVDTAYTGTLNLSTSTAKGDWTVITGNSPIVNGIANDGIATYDMVAADNGVVVLGLKDTAVETVNIHVTDGSLSETSGSAIASEDQDLAFAQSGFVFLADGVASTIGHQIGGKASSIAPGAQSLELQAIRTSDTTGACEAALQGVNAVELAFECRNPSSCTTNLVNVDGGVSTNIAANSLGPVASYTPVNLDFGDVNDSTASFELLYPDVGELQLYARYNIPLDDGGSTPSGIYMTGNSNTFVVRPFGFHLSTAGNPGASSAAGDQFTVAGSDFSINATAVLYQAADDTDNNGIPDNHDDTDPSNNVSLADNTAALNFGQEIFAEEVILSALLDQPAGGNDPGLLGSNTISSFVNGTGSTAAARYDEVGIIEISAMIADSDYLGMGLPATAELLGKSGYVGRFYPDHFAMSNPMLTNREALACVPASNFTYMGENLRIDFELEAWSADPSGADVAMLTQNYVGDFAKLDPAVIADMNYGASSAATNLTARLNAASSGVFVAGVAPVQVTLSLDRNAAPDGQFASLQLGIAPDDGDTVPVTLLTAALDLSLDGGPESHVEIGSTDIRYGRLTSQNSFGSELLAQIMPVRLEYYLNSMAEFVINIDDSCTPLTTADILLYNDQDPKAGRVVGNNLISINGAATSSLTAVAPIVNGVSSLSFSAPGAEGYVDVEIQTPSYLLSDFDGIDQGLQGPGAHCTPGLAAGDPALIAGCIADAILVDDVPISRASFGIFKGSENVIYIREVY